ncbi:MAG: hypothetical protein PUJ27_10235 [Lachnobacterium sp.]|nr:hypothetical protein [Lachnobacterium sp.]MDY5460044.1 hypothetical protein [Agathobacter sp.]
MNEKAWMVIKEIVLLAGLGIMSVEDIRKKGIKRLWLIGLGIVGLIFTIADAEVLCVSFLLRFVPGVVFVLLAWATREQIGMGDALLILVMGWYLNAIELVDVCLLAFFIAGLVALVLLVVLKKSKKFELPMVPFIFAGYVVMLCLV